MKSVFYLKRKAHKLVNIIFYLGFFVVGYICAKGSNIKIDIIKELLKW